MSIKIRRFCVCLIVCCLLVPSLANAAEARSKKYSCGGTVTKTTTSYHTYNGETCTVKTTYCTTYVFDSSTGTLKTSGVHKHSVVHSKCGSHTNCPYAQTVVVDLSDDE